jgi:hypothetical protein
MLALYRFHVPSSPHQLDGDLEVQHLVEEKLQRRRAFSCRSDNRRMRSASVD